MSLILPSFQKESFLPIPNLNLKPKALFVMLATLKLMLVLMEEPCQLHLAFFSLFQLPDLIFLTGNYNDVFNTPFITYYIH